MSGSSARVSSISSSSWRCRIRSSVVNSEALMRGSMIRSVEIVDPPIRTDLHA